MNIFASSLLLNTPRMLSLPVCSYVYITICIFGLYSGFISSSSLIFDIHSPVIVANFFDIILVPFIETLSIAHVMLRLLVEKKVGGEAFSPAVDADSARFFAHFRWLESTHLYRPSRMLVRLE